MIDCPLCRSDLGPVIAASAYWRLVLNHNQNILGKCFLVSRRHLEAVSDLTLEEWIDLRSQVQQATRLIVTAFQPDHFNYAFLQNQDRHVHLHVIPRYAALREFDGLTFDDPDYPDHYTVPSPARRLPDRQLTALADELRLSQ